MRKLISLILLVILGVSLVGCGEKNTINDKKIVVAASETPHAEILEQTRSYIESQGYELEIKVFNDYVIPNEVTESGEVDANFFQHFPYLKDFNEKHNTHLASVLQVHFEPLGLYQGKRTSLDNLNNAKIAIANDTSNGARGLLLLEQAGIIKLDSSKGVNVTVNDITENKFNVEILELEAAIIPVQLQDLDFAVINGNYALEANISSDKLLGSEASDSLGASTYANIIAVKDGNQQSDAIKVLVDALNQASIRTFIENTYNGIVIPLN